MKLEFAWFSSALFSASVIFMVAGLPAIAQGFKVDRNALEKAKWYKSPLEIQILDDGSGANRGAIDPNVTKTLPRSGFESNYRPSAVAPKEDLPQATSTNVMLKNRPARRPAPAPGVGRPQLSQSPQAAPTVATYGDQPGRGSLLHKVSAPRTQMSVQGELKRGALLGK